MKTTTTLLIAFLTCACLRATSQGLGPIAAFPATDASAPVSSVVQPITKETESGGDSSDEQLYTKATRAIQEARWADAELLFAKVTENHGERAEGALYWLAYAENKQGKSQQALGRCTALRAAYPKSRWIDDCGALEIEIHASSGHPVEPASQSDENLKLLALNSQMHQDEAKALPQIRKILSSDQPEAYKEQALFVLAQSQSRQAQQLLAEVANPTANTAISIKSNPALRERARQLISASQRGNTTPAAINRRIGIDVVVNDAAGKPVYGLNANDFVLSDDNQPQKIMTFHALDGPTDPPSEVLIFIDTINVPLPAYPYVRDEVTAYLKSSGGELKHPTSVFIFDGEDALRLMPPTRDGNALADALFNAGTGARPIRRSSGHAGILPRAQMSLAKLGSLAIDEAKKPGRKMLVWISPGWDTAGFDDDWMLSQQYVRDQAPLFRQQKTMFDAIVALSTGLRQARIQLYCIKPNHIAGLGSLDWSRYQLNLKGVTSPEKANTGSLGLQVLAVQSGGQAINSTSDFLSEVIARCISESEADYFLSFDSRPTAQNDEYHDLKVTVNKPGLTVRTRTGYYAQP